MATPKIIIRYAPWRFWKNLSMGNDFGIGNSRESSPRTTASSAPPAMKPSQPRFPGHRQPTVCQKGRCR